MHSKPFQHVSGFVSHWHTTLILSWQLWSSLCQVINLGSSFSQVSSRLAQSPLAVAWVFYFSFQSSMGMKARALCLWTRAHHTLLDPASHFFLPHCRVLHCRYNSSALQGEWKKTSDRDLKASHLLSLITTDKTLNPSSSLANVERCWSDSCNNFSVCLEMKLIKKKKRWGEGERKAIEEPFPLEGKWGWST